MGRRSRRRLLASFLAASLLVLSCSSDRALDGAQLESDISAQLLPEYPDAVSSVSCPDTADPIPGQSILCVANLAGQVVDVDVQITGTAEALTTTATISARFVAVNEVAALLSATFGDEIGQVTNVDCGPPVFVLEPDESIICRATDPSGTTREFDVRVDQDGIVQLELR